MVETHLKAFFLLEMEPESEPMKKTRSATLSTTNPDLGVCVGWVDEMAQISHGLGGPSLEYLEGGAK